MPTLDVHNSQRPSTSVSSSQRALEDIRRLAQRTRCEQSHRVVGQHDTNDFARGTTCSLPDLPERGSSALRPQHRPNLPPRPIHPLEQELRQQRQMMLSHLARQDKQHQQLLSEIQRLRRERYYDSDEGKEELGRRKGGPLWGTHLNHIHVLGTEKYCPFCQAIVAGEVS